MSRIEPLKESPISHLSSAPPKSQHKKNTPKKASPSSTDQKYVASTHSSGGKVKDLINKLDKPTAQQITAGASQEEEKDTRTPPKHFKLSEKWTEVGHEHWFNSFKQKFDKLSEHEQEFFKAVLVAYGHLVDKVKSDSLSLVSVRQPYAAGSGDHKNVHEIFKYLIQEKTGKF